MARDRTARQRIRRYLAAHGPLEDARGMATKLLKEEVGYDGSSVAFIQLIAAMERDGEISRDVRGKRTYRISNLEAAVAPAPDDGIDYDVLARALLVELAGPGGGIDPSVTPVAGDLVTENLRLASERDRYARELEAARDLLAEIRQGLVRDATDSAPKLPSRERLSRE